MSFADVVAAAKLQIPKKVYRNVDEPAPLDAKLAGKVTKDGITLDTMDLDALGERLLELRVRMSADKKEADRLRDLILTNTLATEGYANPFIEIKGADYLVENDPKTVAYLRKHGLLEKVQDVKISKKKLRDLAEDNEGLAKVLVFDRGRKVSKV